MTLNTGDHAVVTVAMDTALVTENLSLMFSTFGSQMEPWKVPFPADRLKVLSEERHVPEGSTSTDTDCSQRGEIKHQYQHH